MEIFSCKQCYKPFERMASAVLCGVCSEAEQKAYQKSFRLIERYYDKVDIKQVAAITGFSSRKIENGILVRMGKKTLTELSDFKKGFCYITDQRMINTESREPFSMDTADRIAQAFQQLILSGKTMNQTSDSSALQPADIKGPQGLFSSESQETEDPRQNSPSGKAPDPYHAQYSEEEDTYTLSRQSYESLLSELKHLRRNTNASKRKDNDEIQAMQLAQDHTRKERAQEILSILDQSDEELAEMIHDEEFQNFLNNTVGHSEPKRHFGFKGQA